MSIPTPESKLDEKKELMDALDEAAVVFNPWSSPEEYNKILGFAADFILSHFISKESAEYHRQKMMEYKASLAGKSDIEKMQIASQEPTNLVRSYQYHKSMYEQLKADEGFISKEEAELKVLEERLRLLKSVDSKTGGRVWVGDDNVYDLIQSTRIAIKKLRTKLGLEERG